MKLPIIDGYCHCGLRKYRPLEEVNRIMHRFRVERAVLVQHLGEYDNGYIHEVVARDPERFTGVMLVDAQDPEAAQQLRAWHRGGTFRGIRLVADTLQTHPSLWRSAAELGLNLVVFADPTIAVHGDHLSRFAIEHPKTSMVISHLGMLLSEEAPHYRSQSRILQLADHPNIYVQLSGFHMFERAPYTPLVPVLEQLLGAFGPERLFYGSNFPVMGPDSLYGEEIELLLHGRLGVALGSVQQILSGTARSLWFADAP